MSNRLYPFPSIHAIGSGIVARFKEPIVDGSGEIHTIDVDFYDFIGFKELFNPSLFPKGDGTGCPLLGSRKEAAAGEKEGRICADLFMAGSSLASPF